MQESTVAASDLIDFTGKVELIPRPQRVSVCQGFIITPTIQIDPFPLPDFGRVDKREQFSRPLRRYTQDVVEFSLLPRFSLAGPYPQL